MVVARSSHIAAVPPSPTPVSAGRTPDLTSFLNQVETTLQSTTSLSTQLASSSQLASAVTGNSPSQRQTSVAPPVPANVPLMGVEEPGVGVRASSAAPAATATTSPASSSAAPSAPSGPAAQLATKPPTSATTEVPPASTSAASAAPKPKTEIDAYWASQPPAVQVLRNITDENQRLTTAQALAKQGYAIDVPIMVWHWDPLITMQIRQNSGYTWVPSGDMSPLPTTPGNSLPGLPAYDPNNPPPGAIMVSTAFAKGLENTAPWGGISS